MKPITLEDLKTINGLVVQWIRLTRRPFQKAARQPLRERLIREFNVALPPDPEEPSNAA